MTVANPLVIFSYTRWIELFPEFSNVSEPQASLYFDVATLFCNNNFGTPVCNLAQLTTFLDLLTAHVAWLFALQVNGLPDDEDAGGVPSSLVGRVNSATEGSVSVTTELPQLPAAAAYFAQTKYGLAFWAASAIYRSARYVPGPATVPAGGPAGVWNAGYGTWGLNGGWGR